ncbi:hypothetical protein [Mucilaginibacter myungsuensis]|uniref:Porin n=1 Tax=Mucilaginibacter myungsuensis TaxID=649104 RepID=A0A929KZY5_9SPHI|nr:hypothetical protein [Mucilaginibacter myungsuensis]MBE9661635.1 hypothetical protein [Mucilaginibacter myungsuensis]MDN3597779.1 hypothetical protein [Mucilaginibacter myungsuensis]
MINKHYLLFILFCITAATASAQSVDVHFNGLGYLDNREYKEFVPRSRTYSGTRVALDFGLNLDSVNRFVVGVNGLREFGAKPFFGKIDPVFYYEHHSTNWQFNAGAFPRENLVSDFPRALMNDTLRYFRPNVEGLLARYKNEHFTETFFIDWLSRQTMTDREQFIFGASGKYTPKLEGSFYVKHYFFLLHDAGAEVLLPTDHINDNGGAQIRLGMDFSRKQTIFDSLTVEAGGMMSLERSRGFDGFRTPKGIVASVYLNYHRFALYDEFYKGEGHNIVYGDSYFSKKTYNRVDIMYTPLLFKNIKGQFIFSFHQTPEGTSSSQQAFRVTFDLGRKVIARFKE